MIGAISTQNTHPMPNMAQMQKMDNFRQGQVNLSKDDLTTFASEISSNGRTTPEDLKAIIENYDAIDINGDGMSYDELTSYAEQNGIELGGPFSKNRPSGPPPDGPPPNGSGPGMFQMQGSSSTQGSNDAQTNLLKSLLSAYSASSTQSTNSNFSIYL